MQPGTDHDEEPPPDLLRPASHCPHCRTPLKYRHNVPLLGYLYLGGKCAYCGKPISPRYPLVELLAAILTVHAGMHFEANQQLATDD